MQFKQKSLASLGYLSLTIVVVILFFWIGRHLILKPNTSVKASEKQSNEVYERGSEVMPFEQNLTTHTFVPDSDGGTQIVTVNDPSDLNQIQLIREHLQEEAQKFAQGDFSSPAAIHGEDMPGLAALQDGGNRVDVQYNELPNGARLIYSSNDSEIVAALHKWFNAQDRDHNSHENMNH